MIHYSCDFCHRRLEPGQDQRYVVRIEVYPALEPLEEHSADEDRDHLLEIHESLERAGDQDLGAQDEFESCRELRFDLCPECHSKFAKNPLGRHVAGELHFSKN
jgi:uncharacterized protein YlaI